MQTVAVGWQVYSVTHDPLDLGLIGFSQFLPFIVLILPAGQMADRRDRRRILTGCYAIECVCALAAARASPCAASTSAWPVFAVMILFGVARAFCDADGTGPAAKPRAARAVRHRGRAEHVDLAGRDDRGARHRWHPLRRGPATVYATVAVLLAAGTAMTFTLRGGGDSGLRSSRSRSTRCCSGLRFVWRRRPVLGAISLDLFAVLFGGATALLPVYAADVLHVGPGGLGVLRAAPGVGAAVCGVALSLVPITRHVGPLDVRRRAGVRRCDDRLRRVDAASRCRSWRSRCSAPATWSASTSVTCSCSCRRPTTIRGRVSAVNAVFIGASNELGEFESGVTAAWWGTVPAVIVGGCATLVVAARLDALVP